MVVSSHQGSDRGSGIKTSGKAPTQAPPGRRNGPGLPARATSRSDLVELLKAMEGRAYRCRTSGLSGSGH